MFEKTKKALLKTKFGKKLRLLVKKRKGDYTVQNKSKSKIKLYIKGKGHSVIIEEDCILQKPYIQFRGNNNTLVIKKGVEIGNDCSIFLEGNNLTVTIDEKATFVEKCSIVAQEQNLSVYIGKRCMFSHDVVVRTSDSHSIYDMQTKERINVAKSVVVEDDCWILPHSEIFKGATVGAGSIVGSNTTITKDVPKNSLVVGRPQKIVKENVYWTREDAIGTDE